MAEGEAAATARRRLRGVRVAAASVALAMLTGGLYAAAVMSESPAQVAARTRPVTPRSVTARVERRIVGNTTYAEGEVVAAASVPHVFRPATTVEGSRSVVTSAPVAVGGGVDELDVVVVVSGRPVFVVRCDVPFYRDLVPGAEGNDVRALQEALRRAGRRIAPAEDGRFGSATARAAEGLYTASGFAPVTTAADRSVQSLIREQEVAVAQAERDVASARDRRDAAAAAAASGAGDDGGTNRLELREAERALDAAIETLELAQARRDEVAATQGVRVPVGELSCATSLPGVLTQATSVGAEVEPGAILFSVGTPDIVVEAATDAAELRPDQPATIIDPSSGARSDGAVTSVRPNASVAAPKETTDEDGGASRAKEPKGRYQVVVTPKVPLGPEAIGGTRRLAFRVGGTSKETLAVPLAAVSGSASTARMTLVRGGVRTKVDFVPGASGDGWVEVTQPSVPVGEGDEVVVGRW